MYFLVYFLWKTIYKKRLLKPFIIIIYNCLTSFSFFYLTEVCNDFDLWARDLVKITQNYYGGKVCGLNKEEKICSRWTGWQTDFNSALVYEAELLVIYQHFFYKEKHWITTTRIQMDLLWYTTNIVIYLRNTTWIINININIDTSKFWYL